MKSQPCVSTQRRFRQYGWSGNRSIVLWRNDVSLSPRPIPDIWQDPRLEFTQTLEERLLAAACAHSQEKHVALVAPIHPKGTWRQIAKRFKRTLIPIPLKRFSGQTIHRLRQFHVLNGHDIRSYAAQFIRE